MKTIKNYDENGNIGYFLEVDTDYLKELFSLHKDLPILSESKKVNKVEKLHCIKYCVIDKILSQLVR